MSESKKRLVFFVATLNAGGAERVISILTAQLARREYPIEIVLYYDREPFYKTHPAVKITYVQRETGSTNILKNLIWMRRYFTVHADCVISFLAPFNILAAASLLGKEEPRLIVADRNDPRHVPSNYIIRKLRDIMYRFADGIVVQTKHNLEYFSRALQKKCRVIYNPIALGEAAGAALRTSKHKRIVTVGRLMPQKNQTMLMEAFAAVRSEFPEYTLSIYGEGPERMNLEEKINQLDCRECIFLPGNQEGIFDKIADAELFVLSSNYEGMPNALIEAMCLGLPVISTKVSGATDLVRNGENGLLTEVGDCNEMKNALQRMLSDEKMREECGKQAVLLNDALETEKITVQWIEAVESVIDR